MSNGVILYKGPSLLDGRPIVCIATGLERGSINTKTGPMVQTYILADGGLSPLHAVANGTDASVCGDCPHRGTSCYVNLAQGPRAVWDAYTRGVYEWGKGDQRFRGRSIRFGAYGDPAAVPRIVWYRLKRVAAHTTGYTHAWRTCDKRMACYCMASCETEADVELAQRKGYRTFRVRVQGQPLRADEIVCPASAEGGKRRTCATCKACSGAGTGHGVAIYVHGSSVGNHYKERMYRLTLETINVR